MPHLRFHELPPAYRLTMICASCGSDGIVREAWSHWCDDPENDDLLIDVSECGVCGERLFPRDDEPRSAIA